MFENNTLCQLICSLLPNSLPPIGRNQCICEIAFLNLTTKNNLALITENEFIIQIEISPQILNQVQKRPYQSVMKNLFQTWLQVCEIHVKSI